MANNAQAAVISSQMRETMQSQLMSEINARGAKNRNDYLNDNVFNKLVDFKGATRTAFKNRC